MKVDIDLLNADWTKQTPDTMEHLRRKAITESHFREHDDHDQKDHGNWARGIASKGSEKKTGDYALDDDVPVEPGTAPIPEGHIRFFHYSTVRDWISDEVPLEEHYHGHAESLREQGILMSSARGERFGEPNQIWARRRVPEGIDEKIHVEFSLSHDDPRIGGTIKRKTGTIQDAQNSREDATFTGDITPDDIVAVHEPWHFRFREDYGGDSYAIKRAGEGKYDFILDPQKKDDSELNIEQAALRRAKMVYDERQITESRLVEHLPGEHEQKKHGRRGGSSSEKGKGESKAGKQTETPEFKKWFGNSKVVDDDGEPLVVYHGTMKEFEEFDPEKAGGKFGTMDQMLGPHFSADPNTASAFTFDKRKGWVSPRLDNSEGGNIMPVYLSVDKLRPINQTVDGKTVTDSVAIHADIIDVAMSTDKVLFSTWASKSRGIEPEESGKIFDNLSAGKSISGSEFSSVAHFDLDSSRGLARTAVGAYVENFDNGLTMLGQDGKRNVVRSYKKEMAAQGYGGIKYINTAPMETKYAPGAVKDVSAYIVFDKGGEYGARIKSATGNKGAFDPDNPKITESHFREHLPGEHEQDKHGNRSGKQTETPEFKKWFGNSKVVDDDGEPLVVFKGMLTKDWRSGKEITSFDSPNGPWAGFFTSSPEVASGFADAFGTMGEAAVYPVYISMTNPLVIDAKGKHAKEFMFDNTVFGKDPENPTAASAFGQGYDGVIIKNTSDEGDVYVPKDPPQIKSATGNTGTFDPDNPNITESNNRRV